MTNTLSFRCIDYQVSSYQDNNFTIRIYGIDENRNTYCVNIDDFKPFFYIKVGNDWTEDTADMFIEFLKKSSKDSNFALYNSLCNDIHGIKLIKRKTLYNFDANKLHTFIQISCHNVNLIYKIKGLYYDKEKQRLLKCGVEFNNTKTELYETMIPPMLRFFHIQQISPSGWVSISKYKKLNKQYKSSRTTFEIKASYKDIISELDKENVVPYKICSFDIEASSSHGDFPNAIKDYKKVAYDVIDYIERSNCEANHYELLFEDVLKSVFGLNDHHVIDKCFMKEVSYTEDMFNIQFEKLLKYCPEVTEEEMEGMENSINSYFDKRNSSNIQDTGDDTLDDNNNDDMIINEEDEPIETKKKKN